MKGAPSMNQKSRPFGVPDPECERCGGSGVEYVDPGPDTYHLSGWVPCACRGHGYLPSSSSSEEEAYHG
jgi:hypothetical protein